MSNLDEAIRTALYQFEARYQGITFESGAERSIDFARTSLSTSTAAEGDSTLIAIRPIGPEWEGWEPDLYETDGEDVGSLDDRQEDYMNVVWSEWGDWPPRSWHEPQ